MKNFVIIGRESGPANRALTPGGAWRIELISIRFASSSPCWYKPSDWERRLLALSGQFADGLRTKRLMLAEEQAAKTTVKLIFPLAIFIFPALFVVLLGPGVLSMMKTFEQVNQ